MVSNIKESQRCLTAQQSTQFIFVHFRISSHGLVDYRLCIMCCTRVCFVSDGFKLSFAFKFLVNFAPDAFTHFDWFRSLKLSTEARRSSWNFIQLLVAFLDNNGVEFH